MSVMDKKYINVLNCEENVVIVPATNGRCYTFETGSLEEPCVLPIPPEEIRYMNSISKCFKNGVLRFESDEAIEIYEELGIRDPDSILFVEKIDEMLQVPNADYMTRILNITEPSQFERVRGRYYFLTNTGVDIQMKVGRLIEARYKEISAGKLHTGLTVVPTIDEASADKARIKELEEKTKNTDELLAKLLAKISALESKSEDADSPVENTQSKVEVESKPVEVKPKRGRSTKKTENAK